MTIISQTYSDRLPFDWRSPPENTSIEPLLLRTDDRRTLRGLFYRNASRMRPKAAVVIMHPRVDFTNHYTIPRWVKAGFAVYAGGSRSPNNDMEAVHEELVLDVAAVVKHVKSRGIQKVILFGNSGGGSLFGLYQAEAKKAPIERISRTPAGGPTMLRTAEMPVADAMIYVAAHAGQGRVLAECVDPSVVDEDDATLTDPTLDMYDSQNGHRPAPEWTRYQPEFVTRYRAAQLERIRRIDALAKAQVEESRRASRWAKGDEFDTLTDVERQRVLRRAVHQPVIVVHRTMANLNYVDQRLDPNERDYGSLLSEHPELMNQRALGFARAVTADAWLSTWSVNTTNADLPRNVAKITEPSLYVYATRDREVHPRTHARPIFEAMASTDKTWVELDARHYFEPDPARPESQGDADKMMDRVVAWSLERVGEP